MKMKTEKQENLMTNPQAEEIADLPTTDEQAKQVKGGETGSSDSEYKYIPIRRLS
jgi:hypothetical protein